MGQTRSSYHCRESDSFFERYMAFSHKALDFQLFRDIVMAMEQKRHRDPKGVKIVESAYQMNMGQATKATNREITERILRDYTPNPLPLSGEDIVRS